MSDQSVHVEVTIGEVKIVKKSYTLYRIDLKIIRGDQDAREYHVFRRFSEFIKLRQNLEQELHSELPYELPPRRYNVWGRPSGSCDPDIIEERKKELTTFLHDMLNDSFDTRWKNSAYVYHFLQIPSTWDKPRQQMSYKNANDGAGPSEEIIGDAQKWLEELRNCKSQFEGATKDEYSTKILVQLRLRIQALESSLEHIQEKRLVGEGEIHRRWNLLNALKNDLNKVSKYSANSVNDMKIDEDKLNDSLFARTDRFPQKPVAGRRKIGETQNTIGLQNQELLQLDKNTMKEQDKDLEQLRRIIQNQKNMSLEMNQELATQNELLDMLSGDVESTSNKLRMANRKAKKFSDG